MASTNDKILPNTCTMYSLIYVKLDELKYSIPDKSTGHHWLIDDHNIEAGMMLNGAFSSSNPRNV